MTMNTDTLWAYPNGFGHSLIHEIIGFQVAATDGQIGRIDDATDQLDAAAIVVDTGFWIFGKKRMIPAGVIESIDADAKVVCVAMTKDQIKHAPDYIDEPIGHPDLQVHRDDLSSYYSRWWG